MSAHTPGEWRSGNELGYGSLNGTQIKSVSSDLVLAVAIGDVPELDSKANAAFIVKAVNCHDEMLAALKLVREFDCKHAPALMSLPFFKAMHEAVFAAIAKAEGRS